MITVKVREFENMFGEKSIKLSFNGKLNTGDVIDLFAQYNMEGKLINCSSAYSSMNSADYYIEIAKVFQKMKDFEGEEILKIIKDVEELKLKLDENISLLSNEYWTMTDEYCSIQNKYIDLQNRLKRARSEKTISELTEIFSELDKKWNEVKQVYNELNKKYHAEYSENMNKLRFEICNF